jgi:hypothetical protein
LPYPQIYKDDYPERLINILKQGNTLVAFCAEVMVSKKTLYDWLDIHPKFKEAYELGMALSEQYWIKMGEDNVDNPDFNYNHYAFQLGSRFGISKTRKAKGKKVAPSGKVVKNPKNLLERFNNAILDYPDGEISIEELEKLGASFSKMADIKEREDIAIRVAEIEASMNAKG